MDYSLLTEQQLQKRYDSLPDNLRGILNSENTIETIRQISRSHYLDEERSLILEQLAGLVILGFLSDEKLGLEIQENLLLNPKHASELSQEIDRKIFSPIRADLEKIYSPADSAFVAASAKKADLAEEGSPIAIKPTPLSPKATVGEAEPAPIKITEIPKITKTPKLEKPLDTAQDKPFIIHEEAQPQPVTEKKPVSFPTIGWFKKAMPAGGQEKPKTPELPIKVELEAAGIKPEEKKEPPIAKTEPPKQKVIHYREAPTTPFGTTPPPAPPPTPPKPPEIKPPASVETTAGKEEPRPSPETTADKAKVINLESFE